MDVDLLDDVRGSSAQKSLNYIDDIIMTILSIFLENNWSWNFDYNPTNNPPSNFLWIYASFQSFLFKYDR